MTRNDYGVFENLVRAICPALGGPAGAAQGSADRGTSERPATDRFDGRSYALRAALQDIADAEGNVDAYIALVPASARKQPGVAAEIGHRLLKAGRAEEALAALEPAAPKRHGSYLNDDLYYPGYEGPWPEWEEAYLEALDATGQRERAEPRTTRGGQPWYSELAILTALTLRAVFRLALPADRRADRLHHAPAWADLPVPDHTTLCRRAATLEVPRPRSGNNPMLGREAQPVHLLVDSTGLKLCGPR